MWISDGLGSKGRGWDHDRNMSRNATALVQAGYLRRAQAARLIGIPVDRLRNLIREPVEHHVGTPSGRIKSVSLYDPDAVLDAACLELQLWGRFCTSERAAERVLAHYLECHAEVI